MTCWLSVYADEIERGDTDVLVIHAHRGTRTWSMPPQPDLYSGSASIAEFPDPVRLRGWTGSTAPQSPTAARGGLLTLYDQDLGCYLGSVISTFVTPRPPTRIAAVTCFQTAEHLRKGGRRRRPFSGARDIPPLACRRAA